MNRSLLRHLVTKLPRTNDAAARAAVTATVEAMVGMLPKDDMERLRRSCELPAGDDRAPTTAIAASGEESLYDAVALQLGVTAIRAREIVRTVVSGLPLAIDRATQKRLEAQLPAGLATLLVADHPQWADDNAPGLSASRGRILLSIAGSAVLLAVPLYFSVDVQSEGNEEPAVHAEPEIVSGGEVRPELTTEGYRDPEIVTFDVVADSDRPRTMLQIEMQGVFLPRPVAGPPRLLRFGPNAVLLSDPQRAELAAMATRAKEDAGLRLLVITTAEDRSKTGLFEAESRTKTVVEELTAAGVSADRIDRQTRAPQNEPPLPAGTVAVGFIETPPDA